MSKCIKKFESKNDYYAWRSSNTFISPSISVIRNSTEIKTFYDPYIPPTFAGMEITEGNIYRTGTGTVNSGGLGISQDPFTNSYGEKYQGAGSYYFSYDGVASYFDSRYSFSSSSGHVINNGRKPFGEGSGWRLPSRDEINAIIGNESPHRPGGYLNNNYDNGVTHAFLSVDGVFCILLFPDDENIIGPEISNPDTVTEMTREQVNEFLAPGRCRLLTATGCYSTNGGGWKLSNIINLLLTDVLSSTPKTYNIITSYTSSDYSGNPGFRYDSMFYRGMDYAALRCIRGTRIIYEDYA